MACSDVALVVASTSFLSQTANLAATTLYTPSAAGNFRVSVYHSAASNPNITITISWTDELNGSNSVQFSQVNTINSAKNNYGIAFIRSAASSDIQISVAYASVTYSVYVVVEQL